MQTYELTYIIADSVADDKTSEVMQEVTKQLESLGAVIIKEEAWGKRKLAFPIKKSTHGTYVTLQTHLEGARMQNLDRFLQLHPTIIRHLMLSVIPQTVKTTDEAELAQALDKRVEEKIAHKEIKVESKTKAQALIEKPVIDITTEEEKPTRKRKGIKTNEEEKKQESADERKKLVEEKLSEILGEE